MRNASAIINKTRRTINYTLIAYVVLSLVGLVMKLMDDKLTTASFASIAIGIIVIYSLFFAKEWAKLYVTLCCVIIIIFSTIPAIVQLKNGSYPTAFINLAIIAWSVYLIRFLNVNDDYLEYSQLVNSGFDTTKDGISLFEEIISIERTVPLDRKKINNPKAYVDFTKSLLMSSFLAKQFESIKFSETSIEVETKDLEYELPVSFDSNFFNVEYIETLSYFVQELSEDHIVSIVYPGTIANRKNTRVGILSKVELEQLKSNGMIA